MNIKTKLAQIIIGIKTTNAPLNIFARAIDQVIEQHLPHHKNKCNRYRTFLNTQTKTLEKSIENFNAETFKGVKLI